jgi:DMSO/TMAO reductase YedYZ molybdopterin-dependent catalytic subunit
MSDVVTENPLNRHASWEGLEHDVTPTEDFFCRNHNPFPAPPDSLIWAGQRLTADDLANLPQVEHVITLECAGNGRTEFSPVPAGTPWGIRGLSTGHFGGVAVKTLLERFPPTGYHHVIFQGADVGKEGLYERSLSLEEIENHNPILALRMNGQPLALRHGAPIRLVVPQFYAMVSIKWLQTARYSAIPSQGYFQVKDYLVDYQDPNTPVRPATTMRPKSILVHPREGDRLMGPIRVTGKAWSGEGEVEAVDLVVSGSGGEQRVSATLDDPLGPYAWRSFSALLSVPAGPTSVQAFCRAGQQEQPRTARWNAQGYENNSAHRVAFEVEASDQA